MGILTVPLNGDAEIALENLLKFGYAQNKAEVARKAIIQAEEEEAIKIVLASEQDVKEGKMLSGNLREIIKKI